jgi:DNA mismatch repair ATPase MutS
MYIYLYFEVHKGVCIHVFVFTYIHYFADTIGDVQSSITDRQRALLLEVEDTVLDAEGPLQQLASLLSQVDAIISLG